MLGKRQYLLLLFFSLLVKFCLGLFEQVNYDRMRTIYMIILLLLLLLKKVGSARPRESDIHAISLNTPAPQYQPIERKKRKGKIEEGYSRDRAA